MTWNLGQICSINATDIASAAADWLTDKERKSFDSQRALIKRAMIEKYYPLDLFRSFPLSSIEAETRLNDFDYILHPQWVEAQIGGTEYSSVSKIYKIAKNLVDSGRGNHIMTIDLDVFSVFSHCLKKIEE